MKKLPVMQGAWQKVADKQWGYFAPDGSLHAIVQYNFQLREYVAWTYRTEGNNRFKKPGQAMRCAERRLRELLGVTEALRERLAIVGRRPATSDKA